MPFTGQLCVFPSTEGSGAAATYEPVGCNEDLNSISCSATYTCRTDASATCNCFRVLGGLKQCTPDDLVTELIRNCQGDITPVAQTLNIVLIGGKSLII